LHGIVNAATPWHSSRYVDYDIYYTYGVDLHDRYYKESWAACKKIRSSGSLGLTRNELYRLKHPRPNNIIFSIYPSLHEDYVFDAVLKTASAFPDRTIFLSCKPGYCGPGKFRDKIDKILYNQGLTNLFMPDLKNAPSGGGGRIYELMLNAQYLFGDGSTVIAEGVQFGLASFNLDLGWPQESFYYRDYPHFCLHSADEIIAKIRQIDKDPSAYKRKELAGLINLSGEVVWDTIRRDTAQEPIGAGRMPHLNFVDP